MFIPALECIRTLYPGAYARGATSMISHVLEARKGPRDGREL